MGETEKQIMAALRAAGRFSESVDVWTRQRSELGQVFTVD